MRIGIISFWSSNDNYGQQLQCWALQQVLKDMGHDPFHIKYVEEKHNTKRKKDVKYFVRLLLVYPIVKHILWRVKQNKRKRLLEINRTNNIKRDFDGFRRDFLVFTDKVYNGLKDLKNAPPVADAYITGSDQVWGNVLEREEYSSYFLNFGKDEVLRISYAASFGMKKYPQAYQTILKKCLSRLSFVSCRENAGVKICESVGIKAMQVLDPTLLLPPDYYISNLSMKDFSCEPYIFIYSLNINKPSVLGWRKLQRFAAVKKMRILITPASGYTLANESFENADYRYPSIPEWIDMIRHCELFIASSFHGIVFCILFHRPFVYVPIKGKWSKSNNRVLELLEMFHLKQCIISSKYNYDIPNIDWREVDVIMSEKRSFSYNYLYHALG